MLRETNKLHSERAHHKPFKNLKINNASENFEIIEIYSFTDLNTNDESGLIAINTVTTYSAKNVILPNINFTSAADEIPTRFREDAFFSHGFISRNCVDS